jgi:hypothetical protein
VVIALSAQSDFVSDLIGLGASLGVLELRNRVCEVSGDELEFRGKIVKSGGAQCEYIFGGAGGSNQGVIDHVWFHAGMLGEGMPFDLQSDRLVDEDLAETRREVRSNDLIAFIGLPLLAMITTPRVRASLDGRRLIAACLPRLNWVTYRPIVYRGHSLALAGLTEEKLEEVLREGFLECSGIDQAFAETVLAPIICLLPYSFDSLRKDLLDTRQPDVRELCLLSRFTSPHIREIAASKRSNDGPLWGSFVDKLDAPADIEGVIAQSDPYPETATENFPNIVGLRALCDQVLSDSSEEESRETLTLLLGFHRSAMLRLAIGRGLCATGGEVFLYLVGSEAEAVIWSEHLSHATSTRFEVKELVAWILDSWQFPVSEPLVQD